MAGPFAAMVVQFARRYFPQIMLPITITIGFIGYSIENYLRPPVAPANSKSRSEMREERRLKELADTVPSTSTQENR